jgi:hypothetical protein
MTAKGRPRTKKGVPKFLLNTYEIPKISSKPPPVEQVQVLGSNKLFILRGGLAQAVADCPLFSKRSIIFFNFIFGDFFIKSPNRD